MSLRSIHRMAGLAMLMAYAGGVPDEVQEAVLPLANCPKCKHRTSSTGSTTSSAPHCYMFVEKPGERCGQFRPETWADVERNDAAKALQDERRRRKAEAWAKRQPKTTEPKRLDAR